MKRHMPCGFALAALLGMLAAPALLAQGHASGTVPHAPQQAPAPVPDHSASGVVKFVDRTRLVITRAGKTPIEMTFSVNPSTQKEGAIAAGVKVQVRFRGDAHAHTAVATAILATVATAHPASARHPE
jgi:hypothetical protein